ncbi:MAG: YfbK domain-containing protein [Bacteroidota bacterium]
MLKTTFLSLAIASLLSLTIIASMPTGNDCSIYGKVADKTTNKTIPFASIVLYDKNAVPVGTTTSDANGEYCFKNIKTGIYKLSISYNGYKKETIANISVSEKSHPQVDLKLFASNAKADSSDVKKNKVDELNAPMDRMEVAKCVSYNMVTRCGTGISYESMNFNTEEYDKINDNDFKEATKNPLSTFSIDVDRASYSNVRRFVTRGSLPPADAVRIEEMINYFSYNYPQPKGSAPFSINTEYTDCPWNTSHQLIHIGLQGKEIELENMPANNLVFLVDVSGSMDSPDKLPLLKSGLRLLIDQLRPQDQVAIVVYAGAAGTVLPCTPGTHKEKIIDALDKLQAGGSTAGGEGIVLAYKTAKEHFLKNGNNRVILATDGDFNVGVSSNGELVRLIEEKREQGVFLTVLGFGTGNYKDSKMEQLADKGNGNYAYVDDILEAKKVLVKEMGGTLLTIAKDVKIQIEFNPAKVKAYRLVGYENRLLNSEDFNDDKKDAGELGSGHTVTAIYEIIPAGSKEEIPSIDPLKYQPTTLIDKSFGNEMMTVKFRYKDPNESASQLITHTVSDKKTPISLASENCKFSISVAEFGMILRDSKFKGGSNYKNVMALARESKGKDDEGYRAEFIRLVEMAELLKK